MHYNMHCVFVLCMMFYEEDTFLQQSNVYEIVVTVDISVVYYSMHFVLSVLSLCMMFYN